MPSSVLARDVVRPGLRMPFGHESLDNSLRLPVGPWMLHLREMMRDSFPHAQVMQSMTCLAFVLRSVVRIDPRHLERACEPRFLQEYGSGVGSLVGKDVGEQPAAVIVDRDEEIFSRHPHAFSAQERKPLGIEMYQLSGRIPLVPLLPMLSRCDLPLKLRFGLLDPSHAPEECPVPVIHARAVREYPEPRFFQDLVHDRPRHLVFLGQVGDPDSEYPPAIHLLSLKRQQFGILMHTKNA